MLHHVEIYVSDLDSSRAFWSGILARIGYAVGDSWDDGFTLESDGGPYLTFVQREDRYASLEYHRCTAGLNHLAFEVRGRAAVDALREYCADNGTPELYAEKYPFANGGTDYYALFVEDPDRIKVEFVAT